jgi:hypothetical protein
MIGLGIEANCIPTLVLTGEFCGAFVAAGVYAQAAA